MVKQSIPKEQPEGPPPIDESWWTALLAEEEKPAAPTKNGARQGPKTKTARQQGLNWQRASTIYEQDETISLRVSGFNRGGLLVDGEDLQGFVPISHLVDIPGIKSEEERERLLGRYIDCTLVLKVIECDPARGRVVFSERAALSAPGRRTQLLKTLQPGDRLWGAVTNITDFGIFVDLGGLEGLIHLSELSWGRVRHPADVLELGERIEVYVISVNRERLRVALSLKRLHPNPWEYADDRYHPGMIVDAVITSLTPFGAFARLEDGLDGLIHISEICSKEEGLEPGEVLSEGQSVVVRVIQVDANRQRLGLSLLQEPPA